ncbi:hypothetical protein R6Q59_010042 [Mikania micrantha]
MVHTFLLNMPFTVAMLLAYLFSMPSVTDALSDPSELLFIYVFRQTTSTTSGTTGMSIIILLLIAMITASTMASVFRQTFAFARDFGLPFSHTLSSVHPHLQILVNSIVTTCLFTIVISLINIGSTVAFNAVLSLSCVALTATSTLYLSATCSTAASIYPPPYPARAGV